MIRDYFGEWTSGRLGRKRFAILYALAVAVTFAAMMLLLGGAYGVGKLASDPEAIARQVGTTVLALWVVAMVVVAVGLCNIVGKRGRDIGVPGWAAILAFLLVVGIGRGVGGGGWVTLLFAIVLALIPTGQLARGGTR